MSLLHLVRKNITGNAFRSIAVILSAALVASLILAATFVVRGAETSLRLNLQRLGAEILVLPWGTMTDKIGGVRLMSAAIDGWMPRAHLDNIASLEGIEAVSPQLHLASLEDSPFSSRPEIYLVAYDPATDFTLQPWLEGDRGRQRLQAGEAIAGARITIPGGSDEFALFGQRLELADRLEPTATSIDDTVFVNFETAEEMLVWSAEQNKGDLQIVPNSISAIMVKLSLGSDPHEVAVRILEKVPGVVPLETPGLFRAERLQMIGVLRTMLTLLGIIWALTLVFMGLVFVVSANERRWEIGVLRSLGLSRGFVLTELLLEGGILALVGGSAGVVLSVIGFTSFGSQLVSIIRLPFHLPSAQNLIAISLLGQVAALATVTLAAFVPAWRISHQEVAITMRE